MTGVQFTLLSYPVPPVLALALVLLTSFAAMLVFWTTVPGLIGIGQDPLLAALAGVAVALAWAAWFAQLGRFYLVGNFPAVRRRMRVGTLSLGPGEAALTRLSMAVERRDQDEGVRALEFATSQGLGSFAHAWHGATVARLAGRTDEALDAYERAAHECQGLDRVEMLCEWGLLVLQTKDLGRGSLDEAVLHRLVLVSNEAAQVLQHAAAGPGGRARANYVAALQQALRALIYRAQGRFSVSLQRTEALVSHCHGLGAVRARGLAQLLEIESAYTARLNGDLAAFDQARVRLDRDLALPSLLLRLQHVKALVRDMDDEEAAERLAARVDEPEPESPEEREPAALEHDLIEPQEMEVLSVDDHDTRLLDLFREVPPAVADPEID